MTFPLLIFAQPSSIIIYYHKFILKNNGFIASNIGTEVVNSWVSPIDIAIAIAEEIASPFVGRKVRYVASEEITYNDLVSILGKAIGNPELKWLAITDVKSNPQEIGMKLDSAFGPVSGFVFNMNHDDNDSAKFKLRKRGLNYLNFIRENQIIVNGKILKTDKENETEIEISFTQHFLTILYVSFYGGLGLLAMIFGISSNAPIYLFGGILLAIGIALWIDVQKTSKKYIQKYKTLISEILED